MPSFVTIDGTRYFGSAGVTAQVYIAIRSVIDAGESEQLVIEGQTEGGLPTRTAIWVTPHTSVHQTVVQDPADADSTRLVNQLPGNAHEIIEAYRTTESEDGDQPAS
jgi:hypothetical protein